MTSLIALVITDGVGGFSPISILPCRRAFLESTTYAGRGIIDAAGSIVGDADRRDSPSSIGLAGLCPLVARKPGSPEYARAVAWP